MSLPLKFLSKIKKLENGCWIWMAGKISSGYGAFYENGTQILSHRYSYEKIKGEIPNDLELDHLCRNRACCNPDHLEAVTRKINLLRGKTLSALNASKTHCPHGHPYITENLIKSKNHRDCRICNLIRSKSYYHKMKNIDPNFLIKRNARIRKRYQLSKLKKERNNLYAVCA